LVQVQQNPLSTCFYFLWQTYVCQIMNLDWLGDYLDIYPEIG
jgi:hypothetical protein